MKLSLDRQVELQRAAMLVEGLNDEELMYFLRSIVPSRRKRVAEVILKDKYEGFYLPRYIPNDKVGPR